MELNRTFPALLLVTGLSAPGAAAEAPRTLAENDPEPPVVEIIFGTDDRVPSDDPRVGRITSDTTPFCTGWLLSNGAFLTAGHCARVGSNANCLSVDPDFQEIEFNVPLSQPDGTTNRPPQRDRYPIVDSSVQCQVEDNGDFTKDWALFAVGVNHLGQSPVQNQKGFFRPAALANFPPANTSAVRVTGFGVDGPPPNYGKNGPPRNVFNKTQQTAAGKFLGLFATGGFFNLRYVVDTNKANSGSPVFLNGTSLALGIHDGSPDPTYNYATSFQLPELAQALHAFPGTLLAPTLPGGAIFYVDSEAPAFVDPPNGNLFTPFPTLTDVFTRIAAVAPGTATLISVVTGSYPEKIDQATSVTDNITVDLKGDATLVLPVGSVTVWGKAGAPVH
jgi:Trypsin